MRLQTVTLCLMLLLGVCMGCADDADFDSGVQPAGGRIVLRVGTGAKTRTQLGGSYNLNHVRQVYAILYEGTGDGATYVCHHDLKWSPVDSADYGEGVVQEKVYEFSVPSSIKSNVEYTLLCVGLDDQSGTTYGLSLSDDAAPSFCAKDKTLADAKAILATGKSMTKAELFAGWTSFTYSRKDENSVEVELTRRVSGAYAYLKDIPISINGKKVEQIQLVLGNLPNTQIGLARKERSVDNMLPDDFGSEPTTDESTLVLDKLMLKDIVDDDNTNTTNLYNIKKDYTDALELTSQTLLLSAYLLPMEHGSNGTLAIQLLDGSGVLIKSFPAQWDNAPTGAGDAEKYSLYPNYVYHVGTRSDDSDRPASLAGNRIVLEVQPWTEVKIETEFPKVPLEATIDYDKNPSSYIYDCINTTDQITIMPSLLKRKWKMTIVAEDNNGNLDTDGKCDWIYFVKGDDNYPQTLTSDDYTNGNGQAVAVTIRLNDYVVQRSYDPSTSEGQTAINTDWRRARIVLTTDQSSSPTHLSIRQYNAITVTGNYDKRTSFSCGFSRYDYGVVRDKDGYVTTQGYKGKWGINDKYYSYIYQKDLDNRTYYDGYFAHENVEKDITSNSSYWGTDGNISSQPTIRYSWTPSWVYEDGTQKLTQFYWYLPSQYELYGFFNTITSKSAIETHIEKHAIYWSSTARPYKDDYTYCQIPDGDGSPKTINASKGKPYETSITRNSEGYSRRARHFEGYTGGLQ